MWPQSCLILTVFFINNVFANKDTNLMLRTADPDVPVSSISEYPYFASIQPHPGIFQNIAFNAIFVASSWVLTFTLILDVVTTTGDTNKKKKRLVVVSDTTDAGWIGNVRRIKKIIVDNDIAVLKVSGEIHPFAPPVKPRYAPAASDRFTLLRWDVGLGYILKSTNVEISPASDCVPPSPNIMCIPSIPLMELTDVCAMLVNSKNELVGMVVTPTFGTQPVEYLYKISAVSNRIREMVLDN